ncbi:DUF922 domain-containing protein [Geomesophilobacter sediminis]|uniref:DUF922 domain-containing protein n=1 Tax=Geomesophilobacter sediminis TaxID=2798584 RepID=A0A8J7M1V7_9BACT|nr:DUF922 domain-containing protein [Geomesophilobacter sediminis]MBJ6726969.1 DUF922 domain-containing protein [Geomesophilobacter sediminis]
MSRSKGGFFTNLFQPTPPAPACELNVKEHYDFYDINGTSVGDLRKQMRSNGTRWNDGRVYAALTTWDIHYNYDIFEHDGRCGVKSVATDVDIVYHFPRRITSLATPDVIGGVWSDYYEHLKVHEFGHKELAIKAAGEINETLASLDNFSSRTDLEREVKRLIDAKLKKLNDDQVEYDAETHHGATQGAVLPDN